MMQDTDPIQPDAQVQFSEAERSAMRAYLQRCEVRLSTLHRIATAFIGGAGLMLLIPVFFKDVVDNIISILLHLTTNHFPEFQQNGVLLTVLLFLFTLYPLALSLIVPVYGVFLLLKDIVHFYYTAHIPGFNSQLFNPTFALTGLTFSPDESEKVKREVLLYEYVPEHIEFMLPFSQQRREQYYDTIIQDTDSKIIPPSRTLEKIRDLNGLNTESLGDIEVQRFNAALGVVGSTDRRLVQEVAVAEMSLARHVNYLRRLVMRYTKTLLMFLWTTLVSFIMLPFLKDTHFPPFLVFAFGYLIWAVAVMRIMHLPLKWIYHYRNGTADTNHIDMQLRLFEDRVKIYAYLAIASAVGALSLALFAQYSGPA